MNNYTYLWQNEREKELLLAIPQGAYGSIDGSVVSGYTGRLGLIAYSLILEDQVYKQLKIVIGIDTPLAVVRERVAAYFAEKEEKYTNPKKGARRFKKTNITKKRKR